MKMKKILALLSAGALTLGLLAGCGGSGNASTPTAAPSSAPAETAVQPSAEQPSASAGTAYTVHVDGTAKNGDWLPSWMFLPSCPGILYLQAGMRWDLELTVDGDRYTMVSIYQPMDEAVVEGDASYQKAKTVSEGKCISVSNTEISIAPAEKVDYELGWGAFMDPYIEDWLYDDNDSYHAEYSSADTPELLEVVPATVFTISGTTITEIQAEGHSAAADDPSAGAVEEDLGELIFSQVSSGGATFIEFYPDNVYRFTFPDMSIGEKGTYSYDKEGAVLTLTTPAGNSFASVPSGIDGIVMIERFYTDMSESLGGSFEFNLAELEAAGISAGPADSNTYKQASNGGKTFLEFFPDGIYQFSFPDYGVTEDGTYALDGESVTLTTPAGVTFTAAAENGVCTIEFATDMNAGLGGTFGIQIAELQALAV